MASRTSTTRRVADMTLAGRLSARQPAALVCVGFYLLLLLGLTLGVRADAAAAAARGIYEARVMSVGAAPAVVDEYVSDMVQLHARWSRIDVYWFALQPTRPTAGNPGYDAAYVEQIKSTAAKFEAAGINLIVTFYGVPEWASNKTLWDSPPASYEAGVYQPFYAMDTGNAEVMAAFQATCTYLAATLSPLPYGVRHFECWNEPNILWGIYPQVSAGNANFGASTYLATLKAFDAGVKAADPSLVVIAGATAPQGSNDAGLTAPQRFASYLRDNNAAQYFDAYSHHPYPYTGQAPDQLPPDPTHAVMLSNIGTLLQIFPSKPFYITEFAYSTKDMFTGVMGVTEAQQASYLRQSFAMIAKRRQIKALLWFQVRDTSNTFTGLASSAGTSKPSWYAFSGQNSVTLAAPAAAKTAQPFAVSGVLTGREGALAGKRLQLQTRTPSHAAWKTLRVTSTRKDGSYTFSSLKQGQTRYYRVLWSGVCESPKRLVRTK
jgi:hypothetical protein